MKKSLVNAICLIGSLLSVVMAVLFNVSMLRAHYADMIGCGLVNGVILAAIWLSPGVKSSVVWLLCSTSVLLVCGSLVFMLILSVT